MKVVTIGLDLAKHIFQVHGADAEGRALLRKPGAPSFRFLEGWGF
jgi:transposase